MTLEMWLVVALIVFPLTLVILNRWRIDVAALFMIIALGLAQFWGLGVLAVRVRLSNPCLPSPALGNPWS